MERLAEIDARENPPPIRCGGSSLRFGERVYLMGVLNVTPDSFSDGGRFADPKAAIDHALQMVEEGADLIDVGGESSRPGSDPVSADEELRRVIPVIEAVAKFATAPISIDTTKALVAEQALEAGAVLVNDISALTFDPRMPEIVSKACVPVVLMHMLGVPKTMQHRPIVYDDVLADIGRFMESALGRAEEAGIPRDKIIIDPGIGFGKEPAHNLVILHQLARLRALHRPILVGPSRKAFLGAILRREVQERLQGTAVAVAAAVLHGADIVRVHDVSAMRQVADVAFAIRQERLPISSR